MPQPSRFLPLSLTVVAAHLYALVIDRGAPVAAAE